MSQIATTEERSLRTELEGALEVAGDTREVLHNILGAPDEAPGEILRNEGGGLGILEVYLDNLCRALSENNALIHALMRRLGCGNSKQEIARD